LSKTVKVEMKKDRDLVDKGSSAFVSFVRYYKEHRLSFIFNFNSLDFGQVANSFFLFSIPRVKEILGRPTKNFIPDKSVSVLEIPYVDKNK
jgi:ATP-dependent RNA helicase DDX55/SPB4